MRADVINIQNPHVVPEVTEGKIENISHVGTDKFCHLCVALLASNVHDQLAIEHGDAEEGRVTWLEVTNPLELLSTGPMLVELHTVPDQACGVGW